MQGPHHVAKKSTRTTSLLASVSLKSLASLTLWTVILEGVEWNCCMGVARSATMDLGADVEATDDTSDLCSGLNAFENIAADDMAVEDGQLYTPEGRWPRAAGC